MLTIYHNPRCRKSREALNLLEEQGVAHSIRLYLTEPLNESELTQLLIKLNIDAFDLVRTNEAIWKEQFKGKSLSEAQTIQALLSYPKLIERPIIADHIQAIIGRPLSNVQGFLEKLKQ